MTVDFNEILTIRNRTNAFANMLGLELTEIREGYAKAEMDVTDQLKNPINSVHGGVLFTIADITGGGAAASHGNHITTIDGSFHFLRPGLQTTHLTAEARELKAGKNVLVYDVAVFDQNNVVLAEGIFSYMSLGKPILS